MDKKVWIDPQVTSIGVEMTEFGGKTVTTIDNLTYNTKGEIFASFNS